MASADPDVEVIETEVVAQEGVLNPKTLACNKCHRHIFREGELFPSGCCKEMFCNWCWGKIERAGRACNKGACQKCPLVKEEVFWNEAADDDASRERDLARRRILDNDPVYQAVRDDLERLTGQVQRQQQELIAKRQTHAILDDQLRQGANRLESINLEADVIKEQVESTNNRAMEALVSNEVMEAKIRDLKAQVQYMEGCIVALDSSIGSK